MTSLRLVFICHERTRVSRSGKEKCRSGNPVSNSHFGLGVETMSFFPTALVAVTTTFPGSASLL